MATPSTHKVWQYTSTKGGIVKNLKLNTTPLPKPGPNDHLVQIIAVALNPIDYKPASLPVIGRFIRPKIATPGIDIAGRIITPARGSSLTPGQLVFGAAGNTPIAGGGLAQYALCETAKVAPIPENLNPVDAASVPVAGLTAYQTIVPRVKKGARIFINGGSGGTGIFGIQMAKAAGCHVTTTCSTANVELCRSLGADEVLDYRKENVLETLASSEHKFDHVVDNVGLDGKVYFACSKFTKPDAEFVMVGAAFTWRFYLDMLKIKLWPAFLGGRKRKYSGFFANPTVDDLEEIAAWMSQGIVKSVIDSVHPFESAPQAFEKLQTGRARGKIVITVSPQ